MMKTNYYHMALTFPMNKGAAKFKPFYNEWQC